MDQERFDHLARSLVSGRSRRGLLQQLNGAAIGGILVAVGASEAGAKKKKRGGGKRKGKAQAKAKVGKVAVCHYDADADTFVVINVSQDGWDNGHSKHEQDFLPGDEDGCCLDSECAGLTDQCNVGTCVVNERVGACKAVPTPGETCDGGTCNDSGDCVAVCKAKTCAELGRTCGTAPDDGCGDPLECGPASVCGSDINTNCCGGRCCTANGISCSSDAECCNGDCLMFLGFGTCNAFTNYVCAP